MLFSCTVRTITVETHILMDEKRNTNKIAEIAVKVVNVKNFPTYFIFI